MLTFTALSTRWWIPTINSHSLNEALGQLDCKRLLEVTSDFHRTLIDVSIEPSAAVVERAPSWKPSAQKEDAQETWLKPVFPITYFSIREINEGRAGRGRQRCGEKWCYYLFGMKKSVSVCVCFRKSSWCCGTFKNISVCVCVCVCVSTHIN